MVDSRLYIVYGLCGVVYGVWSVVCGVEDLLYWKWWKAFGFGLTVVSEVSGDQHERIHFCGDCSFRSIILEEDDAEVKHRERIH